MNFFQSQAAAKSQTTRLVFMFVMAVLTLIVLTNLLVMGIFGFIQPAGQQASLESFLAQFDWEIFFVTSIGVLIVVLLGTAYKVHAISGGGSVVAEQLGGRLVRHSTDNFQHKVLLNVVEEMAIAAGTPVPEVYVLEDEPGINAFAAGFSIDDAVIGVTQGALDYFTREELQGVIAHEFSHIINGDMRLNMRLIGILHGILVIGLIGYFIMRSFGHARSKKNGGQIALLGVGLMIIGYGGTFFGNMIKASISRQREYLADASAVQFTRNNQGIADALKKIGGYSEGSTLESAEAPSMSHAFFSKGIKSGFQSIFSTHPPLEKRIKAIDPDWQGSFPMVSDDMAGQLSDDPGPSRFAAASGVTSGLVASIGQLDANNIERARESMSAIPDSVRGSIYSVSGSKAVLFGLLLAPADDKQTLKDQLAYIQENSSDELYKILLSMQKDLQDLDFKLRLPLIEIALPQLKRMSKADYGQFMKDLKWLIEADGQIDIFEWSLEQITDHYLKSAFVKADVRVILIGSMKAVKNELELLLSVLATHYVDDSDRQVVLEKAREIAGQSDLELASDAVQNLDGFTKAIRRLGVLKPHLKEKVINLCYMAVTQDDDYSVEEQETVRALADCLGCPVPMQ